MDKLIDNPLVSVRVLTYNHEKYISQCLEGIISQKTNFPFEIIIGEDCSTDNTRQICQAYKEKYPNLINLIENEQNLGVVANGERTIAAYRGKYIAWCDGDDAWTDEYKLQKQVDILERHPNITICFHPVKIIYENSDNEPLISNEDQKTFSTIYDLAFDNFIHSPSVVFRDGLFDKNLEILKKIPVRDYTVHLLNASKGNIYFINEVMAIYREHKNSHWSSKTLKNKNFAFIQTLDMLIGLFNPQIDDIFTYSKAIYFYDLFDKLKNETSLDEVKQYLILALENTLKIPNFPDIDAVNNKIVSDLLKVIDRDTDEKALFLLSKLALNKHLYEDTKIFLDDVLKINPNNHDALLLQAKAFYKLNNFNKAIEICSKIVEENYNTDAYFLLSKSFYALKQYQKSLEFANFILSFKPSDFSALKLIALSYYHLNNKLKSKEYVEKALKEFPYDIELLNLRAKIKKESSNVEIKENSQKQKFQVLAINETSTTENELVSIIIHTQNNSSSLYNLISSIYSFNSKFNFEILVVDNASQDNTLEILKKFASSRINFRFLRNYNQVPFPRAINYALKNAFGDFIVILNNVYEVSSGWLDELIYTLKTMDILCTLPKIYQSNKKIHSSGVKISYESNKLNFFFANQNENLSDLSIQDDFIKLDALLFDCIAFNKKLIEKIDLMDESFKSFLCEIDFSLRAREKGYLPICLINKYVVLDDKINIISPNENEINLFSQKWGHLFVKKLLQNTEQNEQTNQVEQKKQLNLELLQIIQNLKQQGLFSEIQKIGNILLIPNLSELTEKEITELEIDQITFDLIKQIYDNQSNFDVNDLFEISHIESHEQQSLFSHIISEKEKPRILLTMYGWNESGGGTTFPRSVALAFARRGYNVAVFYAAANHPFNKQPYFLEYKVENGVNLYGIFNRPTVFLDALNPEREIKDENILEIFSKVIDEFKPNIIHYNNFLGLSFSIADISHNLGIPSVFTPHNYHIIDPLLYMYRSDLSLWDDVDFFKNSEIAKNYPNLHNLFYQRIQKAREILNEKINYTLAVSNRVKELFIQFGIKPEKITVVHQIPEQAQKFEQLDLKHKLPSYPIKFGFVGGVLPHKGAHIFVQAAQSIPIDKAQFYIYGFIQPDYLKILKLFDVNQKVIFKGEYQLDNLPEIAENLDIVVVPSITEDCAPLVIAEALALKLPVIASRIGGLTDFVKDGINGRLYQYNSPADLTKIMWEVCENPDLIHQWRQNCKLSHNFDDYLNHLLHIYELLISNEKPNVEEIQLIF